MKTKLPILFLILSVVAGCGKDTPKPNSSETPIIETQEDITRKKYNIPKEVKAIYTIKKKDVDTVYFRGTISNKDGLSMWIGFSVDDSPITNYTRFDLPKEFNGLIFSQAIHWDINGQRYHGAHIVNDVTDYLSKGFLLTTYDKELNKWHHRLIQKDIYGINIIPWFNKTLLITDYTILDHPGEKFSYIMSPDLSSIIHDDLVGRSVLQDFREKKLTLISNEEYIYIENNYLPTNKTIRIRRKSTLPISTESPKPSEDEFIFYDLGFWDIETFEDDTKLQGITHVESNRALLSFDGKKIKMTITILARINTPSGGYEKIEINETKYIDPKTGLTIT